MQVPVRIEKFIETIISRLGGIQDALRDQVSATDDARDADQQAHTDDGWQRLGRTISERYIRKRAERDAKSQAEKSYQQQVILNFLTLLAVLGAYLYASIAFFQGMEMVRATRASEESVKAANKTLKAAQDQLVLGERAWLKFSVPGDPHTFTEGKQLEVPVVFTNIGKTPAEKLWVAAIVKIVPAGPDPNLRPGFIPTDPIYKLPSDTSDWWMSPDDPHAKGRKQTVIPGSTEIMRVAILYPNEPAPVTLGRARAHGPETARNLDVMPITLDEIKGLNAKTMWILVYGQAWYLDIFGYTHWTKFCSNVNTGPTMGACKQCSEYSQVDNNLEP